MDMQQQMEMILFRKYFLKYLQTKHTMINVDN
jgi:hypothetical protein